MDGILLLAIAGLILGTGVFLLGRRFYLGRPEQQARRALTALLPELPEFTSPWEQTFRQAADRLRKALPQLSALAEAYPDSLTAGKILAGCPETGLRALEDYQKKVLPILEGKAAQESSPLSTAAAGAAALENKPAAAGFLTRIARIYLTAGQIDKAVSAARRAEQVHQPPDRALTALLAQIAHRRGRTDQAAALLESRLEPSALKIETLCTLAAADHTAGRPAQALQKWKKAGEEIRLIEAAPEREKALQQLSQSLLSHGQGDRTRQLLDHPEVRPVLAPAVRDRLLRDLALLYITQNRRDQAKALADQMSTPREKSLTETALIPEGELPNRLKQLPSQPEDLLGALSALQQIGRQEQAYPLLLRLRNLLQRRSSPGPEESPAVLLTQWTALAQEADALGRPDQAAEARRRAWMLARNRLPLIAQLPRPLLQELPAPEQARLLSLLQALPPEKPGPPLRRQLAAKLSFPPYTASIFSLIEAAPSRQEAVELLIRAGAPAPDGCPLDPPAAGRLHRIYLGLDT